MTETVDRTALARAAMPLVTHCVASVAARVPRHVRHDELVSAGLLGLAQATRSWDADRGVPFEHYARQRIQGALLDELRGRDWASRSVRHAGRQLRVVTDELTSRLGRAPSDAEVAFELGLTEAEVTRIRDDVDRAVVVHLDPLAPSAELAGDLGSDDPAQHLLGREMRGYLHDAVAALPERLQKVVVDYFFREQPMQVIADELGVTISRVSQLRAQAIEMLRDGIGAQFAEAAEADALPASRVERRRAQYRAAIAAASSPRSRLSTAEVDIPGRLVHAG